MNSHFTNSQNFTKENLKKQFRLSEFLAEKIISSIAFLSIAIIFLIFIFVFKESIPLFHFGKDADAKTELQVGSNQDLKPETYGTETTEDLKPESYGTVTEDLNENSSEETTEVVSENNEGKDKTWSTFFSTEWVPVSDNPRFGLLGLLVGTLKVTFIAILIAGPLAILAALYTSCFASKRTKEIIKPIIEMLAAFPSVVIGFFALMVLATFFKTYLVMNLG